ncbi:class I SAM-dependent methyltransferase [Salinactinospora qingdaonensis]|uniref:Class I SAM-dependent methyltransferase n=1 Tax=Salinactinospora qingdaonensis TaxID=702744 RepID=A0ABP7GK00_9ACTN
MSNERIAAFHALLTPAGQRLLRGLDRAEIDTDPLAVATRLRRELATSDANETEEFSGVGAADLVNAAMTQARLRGRARAKFGERAESMYFTTTGVEQATRASVARYRAARLAATLDVGAVPESPHVADLCCGVGADLIAMAEAGLTVTGLDADPLTAAVAQANIDALDLGDRAHAREADVVGVSPGEWAAVFCDPARRSGRGRVFDPDDYSPPWQEVVELAHGAPAACVKVAPGIDHERVPADAGAEWISVDGEVKEAALWFGAAGSDGAGPRATLLSERGGDPVTVSAAPDLDPPPVASPGRYLYEPDGAIVRAHLVAEAAAAVEGALLDPAIAYITGDRLIDTALCRVYEIQEVMPFSGKRLRSALRERRVGSVTIKKRGSAVDVEKLRRDLKLSGPNSLVVVLTRIGTRPIALLCSEVTDVELQKGTAQAQEAPHAAG